MWKSHLICIPSILLEWGVFSPIRWLGLGLVQACCKEHMCSCKSFSGWVRPAETLSGHLLNAMLFFILIFKAVGILDSPWLYLPTKANSAKKWFKHVFNIPGYSENLELPRILVQSKIHLETRFSSELSQYFLFISETGRGKKKVLLCSLPTLVQGMKLQPHLYEHLVYSAACWIHYPASPWAILRAEVLKVSCPVFNPGLYWLASEHTFLNLNLWISAPLFHFQLWNGANNVTYFVESSRGLMDH